MRAGTGLELERLSAEFESILSESLTLAQQSQDAFSLAEAAFQSERAAADVEWGARVANASASELAEVPRGECSVEGGLTWSGVRWVLCRGMRLLDDPTALPLSLVGRLAVLVGVAVVDMLCVHAFLPTTTLTQLCSVVLWLLVCALATQPALVVAPLTRLQLVGVDVPAHLLDTRALQPSLLAQLLSGCNALLVCVCMLKPGWFYQKRYIKR
jgi:hypothetical protein